MIWPERPFGLLGLGRVGSAVALRATLPYEGDRLSQNLTEQRAAECSRPPRREGRIVSPVRCYLDSPHPERRTRGIVGARETGPDETDGFFWLTPHAGEIVDEAALLQRLQEKRIAGAAIDVYGVEPLPADHAIRKLDNVLLTPHIGYVSVETLPRCSRCRRGYRCLS